MEATSLYPYFEKHGSAEAIQQNRQEIRQAINTVKVNSIDVKMKKIWQQFIKE